MEPFGEADEPELDAHPLADRGDLSVRLWRLAGGLGAHGLREADADGVPIRVHGGKTKAAQRTIPIHKVVWPIIKARLKAAEDGQLFLELEPQGPDRKRSWYVSKQITQYRRKVLGEDNTVDRATGYRAPWVDRCWPDGGRGLGLKADVAPMMFGFRGKADVPTQPLRCLETANSDRSQLLCCQFPCADNLYRPAATLQSPHRLQELLMHSVLGYRPPAPEAILPHTDDLPSATHGLQAVHHCKESARGLN